MTLEQQLKQIRGLDRDAAKEAQARWNSIAKPIGSLGKLEQAVIQLAGITGNAGHISLKNRAVLIFCADHGVVEEQVTQTGAGVTRIVTDNFAKGCSCINAMAAVAGAKVYPIDIGMLGAGYPEKELRDGSVADRKIQPGTRNIARESAMTPEQCEAAIRVGMDAVRELKEQGHQILAVGEMGIGNTTPTAALTAVWCGLTSEQTTGRGAGLSGEEYERKCKVVASIVRRHKTEHPHATVLETLADIGGFEIAGMTGAFIGGAVYGIPIIMDGVISQVAALAAVKMHPGIRDYILPSHCSGEPAGEILLRELNFEPMLSAGLCLGEGSGAVAVLPLLDMGIKVYESMGTFEENSIEAYVDYREEE